MNGASELPHLSAKSLTGKLNRFTYLVAVRNAVRKVFWDTKNLHYNTTEHVILVFESLLDPAFEFDLGHLIGFLGWSNWSGCGCGG